MFGREAISLEPKAERVSDETAAAMGELLFLGDKTANKLKFKEAGLNADLSTLLGTTKIREEVAKDLSENDLELIRGTVGILTSFVLAPIFTDDYGLDHESRQEWEKRAGLRQNGSNARVSDSAKAYYHSNRLGSNRCSSVASLIMGVSDHISNPDLKINLQELIKDIPREFLEKDENNNFAYHGLEDKDKIRVVEKLTAIAREVIFFLKV